MYGLSIKVLCSQGERGIVQCGHFSDNYEDVCTFWAKTSNFSKFMVRPHGQGSLSQCEHIADKGRSQFFAIFFGVFYGWPQTSLLKVFLWKCKYLQTGAFWFAINIVITFITLLNKISLKMYKMLTDNTLY